jgi:hypothetical protein
MRIRFPFGSISAAMAQFRHVFGRRTATKCGKTRKWRLVAVVTVAGSSFNAGRVSDDDTGRKVCPCPKFDTECRKMQRPRYTGALRKPRFARPHSRSKGPAI